MSDAPRWITEAEAVGLLSLDDAIEVLADAYRLKGAHAASSMRRAHVREGEAILHAVGGTMAGADLTGTKTWTYTPGGASPLLVLFSLSDGRVLGVVEAFAMGQMRTAATTGLGTRVLSRPESQTLALLGTGKQALSQAQAVAAVRPLRGVRVFGRDADRRAAMAARVRNALDVDVSEHADVAQTLHGADVVVAITRAADPVITAGMLEPGMHLNAVGAIVPSRRELDESAVARCDVIITDSVEQARDDAGELRAAAAAGLVDWSRIRGLEDVLDRSPGELRRPTDITLFKALGVGLSDVALGAEILRRAHAVGVGSPLPVSVAAPH